MLVVVGLYGVLSFFVAQRRNEIGIRIALGARRLQVIRLVLRDTVAMLMAGVVLGIVFALFAGRAASTLLFGLKADRLDIGLDEPLVDRDAACPQAIPPCLRSCARLVTEPHSWASGTSGCCLSTAR